ncbi:class I SAM-dependent methyltransferase [Skermanella mucosa]|uniref:class I SAM-dependent methyltransferase n=1 Tax=Skermanella mucosa TaxID=1789672 RepID=UPI00192AE8DA|nr:class I SAM-dependent methyltransferase [Skermanella mucosa]UEM22023.1 class I SAM-dependent methyltransferase [Skermanella mucosa]
MDDGGLVGHLKRRIAVEGPISVATFMGDVLGHPRYGYYITADRFGAAGDFVTAPEISQMFGELIGLWCAHTWSAMGAPDRVNLVELGPGRGTLMRDALRAAAMVPKFRDAARVHLVETSPVLRERQRELLAPVLEDCPPRWHDALAGVPDGPLLVIANEFFDALPIRQFVKTAHGWTERMVDVDEAGGGFRFVLDRRPGPVEALIPADIRELPPGSVFEACPAALAVAHELGARLATSGGAALICDYGHPVSAAGETLQAVRRHAFVPVLESPGTADLTAHVDFGMLIEAARSGGASAWGPTTQGAFLTALGIRERAGQLRRRATPAQATDIDSAVHRLIDGTEMGTLFKVLALTDPRQEGAAGL